jgi:O-antigen ligase
MKNLSDLEYYIKGIFTPLPIFREMDYNRKMHLKDKSLEYLFLYTSFLLFIFFIPISIATSQFFLFLSFLVWLFSLLKRKSKIELPSIFIPLLFYSFFTILSIIFSVNFVTSLKDSKELLLFLIVPLIYSSFKEKEDFSSFNYALSFAMILSFLICLAEYRGAIFPQERVSGFLGHYMTQSGVVLISLCLFLSMALMDKKLTKIFWAFVFISSLLSLILTFTRGAWLGAFFAVFLIIILYKPKLLFLAIPIIIVIVLISPISVKNRFLSIFDPNDETNRDRIHMGIAGIRIISKYPLFGSGPDTVRLIYKNFKVKEAVRDNPHLHNNIIQIFAERGIFALISWLWFIIISIKKNWEIFKICKDDFFKFSSLGAIGAIFGFFISGLFEYNFGDSEVKMLFLYIITYPLISIKKSKGVLNEN